MKQGRLAAVVSSEQMGPRLRATRPVAVLAQGGSLGGLEPAPSRPQQARQGGSPGAPLGGRVITLWGYNISGSHDMVICRQAGGLARERVTLCLRMRACALWDDNLCPLQRCAGLAAAPGERGQPLLRRGR